MAANQLVHLDIWLTHLNFDLRPGFSKDIYIVEDRVTGLRKGLYFRSERDFISAIWMVLRWIETLP